MNCRTSGKLQEPDRLIHQRIRAVVEPLWAPNIVFGHGFDHAERVYAQAISLGMSEQANLLIIGASAYLMDAGLDLISGRLHHVSRSMQIASEIADKIIEISPQKEILLECIRYHEAETDVPHNVSFEAKVLHDSDTLDRMGFTGVAMTIEYGNWIERDFCAALDPLCLTRIAPAHDACDNTLDYIMYTRKLVDQLVLPVSQSVAELKLEETSAFWFHVEAQLNKDGLIDHSCARRILEKMCPADLRITPTSL